MSSTFVWYELHTPDAGRAAAFYGAVFGWRASDPGMPDRTYTIVSVGQSPVGGLLQKPAASSTGNGHAGWMGYIGVDNADDFSRRVQQAGGTVHRAAEDIPGVGRFAVVADPQGAIFTIFQPSPQMQPTPQPERGAQGTPSWHELSAADWQSDFDFYANLFGWAKSQAVEMGPNSVYQLFATNGSEPIGGMMTRMNPSQPPAWLFYFNVDEINAAISRVKENGGTVIHGPAVVPGGQQIAICLDPQGAGFGMVGPAAA